MSLEIYNHLSNVIAYVGNTQLNVHSLILEQEMFCHHKLEITLDYDALGYEFMSDVNKQIQLMGEEISVEIKQGEGKFLYTFEGIIDGVSLRGAEGKHGFVVLRASSLTKKLERGKRMDVFCELPLNSVVSDLTKETGLKLENNPMHHLNVSYLMQYNETDWEFLRRLAVISGENLYYTGRKLVFGKLTDEETITASYDKEITDLEFFSQLEANSFHTYSYTYELDDTFERNSPASLPSSSLFVNTATEKAQMLTKEKRPDVPTPLYIESIAPVQEYNARRKAATAAKAIGIRGCANAPVAHIGKLLTIEGELAIGIGTYRITKVRHVYDQGHHYTCEFEGCSGELSNVPQPEIKMPVASSLRGTVLSNEDPQGWGRVQVDFEFAKTRPCDTWLRVMSPDAGKSDAVQTNRGMVFIPEKGDQVMVSFEFGDPNRPFVMGSMFHGKNTVGGGADNSIKSIRTKSGIEIVFDDNAGSLHIADPSGNTWDMDGNGNISVNAPESFVLNTKNVTINASEKINLSAFEIAENSKTHQILTEKTISIESNEQKLKSNNYVQSSTKGSQILSGNTVDIKGNAINLDMGGQVLSPKAPIESRNMTSAKQTSDALLENEMLEEEDNVEEQKGDPKILSIKLFDKEANETNFLSTCTNVEVETTGMAGETVELKLNDDETGEEVYIGDYFVPTNDYIIKAQIRKQERHKIN